MRMKKRNEKKEFTFGVAKLKIMNLSETQRDNHMKIKCTDCAFFLVFIFTYRFDPITLLSHAFQCANPHTQRTPLNCMDTAR